MNSFSVKKKKADSRQLYDVIINSSFYGQIYWCPMNKKYCLNRQDFSRDIGGLKPEKTLWALKIKISEKLAAFSGAENLK